MKEVSCDIICDLIPLVRDGVANRDSVDMVMGHIEDCEACRQEFDALNPMELDGLSIEDENIIASIKRNIFITQMAVLILGAIIGVALTGSMGQFYNFIIMPILGGLSIKVLRGRWHIGFIAVFVLSYVGQVLYFIITNQFTWGVLYGSAIYGMFYISLMALGVVIFGLLRFAFGGEGDKNEEG
ncbi:MAG: hypothetical protein GX329_05145 [Tissierellia bacterium]|nr:hypothetical protein [Tissierellia bacterium]